MILPRQLTPVNDVYFISDKIKEFNLDFNLFYNPEKNRYEIHNFLEKPSLCLTFYNYPDSRLIDKLIKTRKENIENLINEIDYSNMKLESQIESGLLNLANDQIKEVFKYAEQKGNINLSSNQIKNILGNEEQL